MASAHQHNLVNCDILVDWACDGCNKVFARNPASVRFRCASGCDVDYCADCVISSKTSIRFPEHLVHDRKVEHLAASDNPQPWGCDSCATLYASAEDYFPVTRFRCKQGCDYDVCSSCLKCDIPRRTTQHQHPVRVCVSQGPWKCNICSSRRVATDKTPHYRCEDCTFDICWLCFAKDFVPLDKPDPPSKSRVRAALSSLIPSTTKSQPASFVPPPPRLQPQYLSAPLPQAPAPQAPPQAPPPSSSRPSGPQPVINPTVAIAQASESVPSAVLIEQPPAQSTSTPLPLPLDATLVVKQSYEQAAVSSIQQPLSLPSEPPINPRCSSSVSRHPSEATIQVQSELTMREESSFLLPIAAEFERPQKPLEIPTSPPTMANTANQFPLPLPTDAPAATKTLSADFVRSSSSLPPESSMSPSSSTKPALLCFGGNIPIGEYLAVLNLSQYQAVLIDDGIDDTETLRMIDIDHLKSLGIKHGHAVKMTMKLKE